MSAAADREHGGPGSARDWVSGIVSTSAPLLATLYWTFWWDAENGIARAVRTKVPYASLEDIENEGIAIERTLAKIGKVRLLVNLQAVAPRDDPSFEVTIAKLRRKLVGGGQRVVILVRTAVGALQVKRHMREDGFPVEVFTDEEEALACLDRVASERVPRSVPRRSRFPGAA